MCFVSILECFLCQTQYNAKRLSDVSKGHRNEPPRFINVKKCCGYWYCLFNDKNVLLTNHSDRIGKTCGHQFCEEDVCKLSVRTIDCCFYGEQHCIPEVEIKSEGVNLTLPYSVDCYLDPCLIAPEVGRVLYNVLESKDFRVLGSGHRMDLKNETYVFEVEGDVNQIVLTVTVSQRSGEACPQVFSGSFNWFLALAFWKGHKAKSEVRLKDYFSIEKA